METVVYGVANRRGLLIWSAICAILAVGFVISIPLDSSAAAALLFPGVIGLIMCPLLLTFATGRTVVSREGLRTGTCFRARSCRWDEVARVYDEKHSVRASRITVMMIELVDGERLKLKASANRQGNDLRIRQALIVIEDYRRRAGDDEIR